MEYDLLTAPRPEWEQLYVNGKLQRSGGGSVRSVLRAIECLLDRYSHPRQIISTREIIACVKHLVDFQALGNEVAVIGCGPAPEGMQDLVAMGFRPVGIEPVAAAVQAANLTLKGQACVIKGVADRVDLPDASQSLVLMENVLEHVDSVRHSLEEMVRILKPGGVLYIRTTNRQRFSLTGLNWEFSARFYNWYPRLVQESYVFTQLHDRPEWARYSPRPAVHWFTFADLCERGRDAGFARFYSPVDLLPLARRGARSWYLRNPWIRALIISQMCGDIFMWKRAVL